MGRVLKGDEMKAKQYFELASMSGCMKSRCFLGVLETKAGTSDRAVKHWLIAASEGSNESMQNIQLLFKKGAATKEDYANALRAYQMYLDDIRSEQRDKAAAFSDDYRCY